MMASTIGERRRPVARIRLFGVLEVARRIRLIIFVFRATFCLRARVVSVLLFRPRGGVLAMRRRSSHYGRSRRGPREHKAWM